MKRFCMVILFSGAVIGAWGCTVDDYYEGTDSESGAAPGTEKSTDSSIGEDTCMDGGCNDHDSETGSNTAAIIDTESLSEAGSDTQTVEDTSTFTDPVEGTFGSDSDTTSESPLNTDVNSATDTPAIIDTDSETDIGTDAGTDADIIVDGDTATQGDSESGTTDSGTEEDTASETGADSETETGSDSATHFDSASETETIPDTAVNLPLFSFFLTSYESIEELSGSADGFGGDLRYGYTGQGAGLLGADSICEAIAERAMPGAAAKQWRAFLSVSVGPDGIPVNARDRIGEGPWYDRLGRLVAPNLDDLLNERPLNGSETIRDDLPNEWGVPNHAPNDEDGNMNNGRVITGSDEDGMLWGADGTCSDWTSVAGDEYARCGYSWPRNFSGTSWISVVNSNGCEAGVDIDGILGNEDPDVNAIGDSGGYGGFYCFALVP